MGLWTPKEVDRYYLASPHTATIQAIQAIYSCIGNLPNRQGMRLQLGNPALILRSEWRAGTCRTCGVRWYHRDLACTGPHVSDEVLGGIDCVVEGGLVGRWQQTCMAGGGYSHDYGYKAARFRRQSSSPGAQHIDIRSQRSLQPTKHSRSTISHPCPTSGKSVKSLTVCASPSCPSLHLHRPPSPQSAMPS